LRKKVLINLRLQIDVAENIEYKKYGQAAPGDKGQKREENGPVSESMRA
jgi:hypothetical protein